MKNVFQETSDI